MNVLCFGDSNTYGYDPRSYLTARYPETERWTGLLPQDWTIINEGLNGREIPSERQWADLDALFADCGPVDVMTVMLGTNDLLQHHRWTPQDVAERMEAFLRHLQTVPAFASTRLLLIAPPPMARGTWASSDQDLLRSRQLTDSYRKLAERLQISFADAGDWKIALSYDGVHFLPEGHRAFAVGLKHTVESMLS